MVITNENYKDKLELYKKAVDSYYNKHISIITDYEFDMLERGIKKFEEENNIPSSTNKIGEKSGSFIRKEIMTSLSNCYNLEEIKKWIIKTCNYLNNPNLRICVSPKFDGVSLNIVRENNTTIYSTRGDGVKGTIVTCNDLTNVCSYYLNKIIKLSPNHFDVRGEIFITKENFEKLNNELISKGEKPYSNQRNAASGILMSKSERVRYLSFVIWGVKGDIFQNDYAMFNYLYGGDNNDKAKSIYEHVHLINGYNEDLVRDIFNNMVLDRYSVEYPTDGLVFIVDSILDRKELVSEDKKYPLYGTSLKYPPTEVKSTLEEVTFDIGRTGTLTPVGIIKPITIDGVNVTKVTLHNYDYIKNKNLMLNDTVGIIRSGDVIPKIISVEHNSDSRTIVKPIVCPSCLSVLNVTEKNISCVNKLKCKDIVAQRVVYFFSKPCFDVKGIGVEVVKEILERIEEKDILLKSSYFDNMYNVLEYLFNYNIYKKDTDGKNYRNFYNNLLKRKLADSEYYRLLAGLGVNNIGVKTAIQYNSIVKKLVDMSKSSSIEDMLYDIRKSPVIVDRKLSGLDDEGIGDLIYVCHNYSRLHIE